MNDKLAFLGGRFTSAIFQIWKHSPSYTIVTDLSGKIVYANPHFCSSTGYTEAEVLGKTPAIIKSGLTPVEIYQDLWSCVLGGKVWKGELHNKRKNGELYWVYATVMPLFDDFGDLLYLVSMQNNITKRKFAEEQSREVFQMMSEGERAAQFGSWLLVLDTRARTWTEGMYHLLEYDAPLFNGDVGPVKRLNFVGEDSRKSVREATENLLRYGQPFDLEVRLLTEKDRIRWVHMTGRAYRNEEGKIIRIGGALQDITTRKEMVEKLVASEANYRRLSYVDGLTRIFNRAWLDEELPRQTAIASRYQDQTLTVLMLDADYFKIVNDKYGHLIGDLVLERLGQVLQRCIRTTDFAARYGGEEFICMLPSTLLVDGVSLAERIREEFNRQAYPIPNGKSLRNLTLSVGAVQYIPNESPRDILARVDQKLYEAKASGRNQVCF